MPDIIEVLNFDYNDLPIRIIPKKELGNWEASDHTSRLRDVIVYILARLERNFETPWQMSSKLDKNFFDHEIEGKEDTGLIFMLVHLSEDSSDVIDNMVHELVHQ